MDEKIELKLKDWLFNAGLIGLMNILGEEAKDNGKLEIDDKNRLIRFSPKVLENFEYKYFDFFIKRYGKTLTYGKILEFEKYIDEFEENGEKIRSINELKMINDKITFFKAKIKSESYKKAYDFIEKNGTDKILGLEKELKKIKEPKENVDEISMENVKNNFKIMKEIIDFFKKKIMDEEGNIKNYLAAKNIAYVIINNAWSSVSFLNKANAVKDIYEEYKSYFVEPALEYINANKSKFKYKCTISNMPMKDYKNTLGFLNDTGFDVNRKPSHVWNFVNDIAVTPLVTLIYSCVPAGFIYGADKGIFVNANHNIDQLYKINNGIAYNILEDESEEKNINLYKNLLKEIKKEKDNTKYELSDIQIVKFEEGHYKFTLLSRNILKLLSENKEKLDDLLDKWYLIDRRYFYLYDTAITELLNNQNLFSLINKLCYYKISKTKLYCKLKNIEDLLKINLDYIRRLKKMDKQEIVEKEESKKISEELTEKDIFYIRRDAMIFREEYIRKSGNDKKIGSLLYRLQNALRINNVDMFMDALISAHAYAGKNISSLFAKALLNDENFQTLGHGFLLGLLGEDKSKNENKTDKKEGNE
ncbi:Cas8a1 family CRISPR/Cas system-associated protein [Leptotrichia sp. oral taxon 212]|uniref:Cas8a1 family CRISPR/Cas system-associated protein n=1 Tax=Leptotrichia sp. oral taxon 212 TaxID=712357 RepID=UPI0006A976B1|nr:Cas8a1 family CRISPR/Cas system-associated protein [Leptotrichia sp. oral taxon 212]ALA96009.1 CRISPR-associated protein Cst1 [Leptotrichia sp. oral taxon 212]